MEETDFENWMRCLPDDIRKTKPLMNLIIPGSHDSCTSDLDEDSPIGNDQPQWLRDLGRLPAIKRVVHRWSKTQALDVASQLRAGVRYLDLRVSVPDTNFPPSGDSDTIRIVHGLYGEEIAAVLVTVLEFLGDHPQEVILIDVNHFYGFSARAHRQLIALITGLFDALLCPRTDESAASSVTLDRLTSDGRQAIVFYQPDDCQVPLPDVLWPRTTISSPWADTDKLDTLMPFLAGALEARRADRFFVTQGILTPRPEDVVKRLSGSLEKDVADKTTKCVVEWLKRDGRLFNRCGNVVICDFVDKFDFVRILVAINYIAD